MAKSVNNVVLDAALDKVATAVSMVACSAEPTTYTEATATYALADVTVSGADFTNSDGTSGRKVTVAAKSGVPVDTAGTATHVALVDGSALLYVTTTDSKVLADTDELNFPSWTITIADPS